MCSLTTLDGRFGEAWAGEVPNGSHINLSLAARGSPRPRPRSRPRLRPPAPATARHGLPGRRERRAPGDDHDEQGDARSPFHADLTWGAAQLGIGQGVMDAVADEVLPARLADDLLDPGRGLGRSDGADETAVRLANRRGDARRRSGTPRAASARPACAS